MLDVLAPKPFLEVDANLLLQFPSGVGQCGFGLYEKARSVDGVILG